MSTLYEKSLAKLELDQILVRLSDCAGSEGGKEACLHLRPVSDLDEVCKRLEETSAAARMCTQKGNPGFSQVSDISPSLERAERGGSLHPKELLAIAGVLRCARIVKGYVSEDEEPTVLQELFSGLTANKYLEDRIFGAILSEEEIADTASTTLADIRRHMRIQSGKIKESLQKIISSPAYAKFLRDPIITIRQGRYVVPVRSECKNDVPGLVHDVSATGSTYFVEPMSAVNANNALRELQLKEQKEIERILAELSAEAAAYKENLELNVRLLVQLDVIFAKAKLAYHMNAWAPVMNDRGFVDLRKARHPLIDPKKVVPISVRLGGDFDTMIITGPNTGGKTVTLKTIGLLTLMAECGLHIPAGDGSTLSTFDAILADIGDEQSIAQSLSTFSSHMKTIVDVVDQCDSRTLVLFDELGAGTDPAEGAALAMALIEYCRKMGSRVVATTHYAELKLYAMRTKGVINASCEFDVETLQPTYRLLIGIPGKSNAFAISERLGLPQYIIDEARRRIDTENESFETVIRQLNEDRIGAEKAREDADKYRLESEKLRNRLKEREEKLEKNRDKIINEAKQEAQRILKEAKETADSAIRNINQLKSVEDYAKAEKERERLRKNLKDTASKGGFGEKGPSQPVSPKKIKDGDMVRVMPMGGVTAEVMSLPDKDNNISVRIGFMQSRVSVRDVEFAGNSNAQASKPKQPAKKSGSYSPKALTVSHELNLIGMTTDEARPVLEKYLDDAYLAGLKQVTIIHGKGTGVLRTSVQNFLRKNKHVKSFRPGTFGEGEMGVTIVELK